MVLTHQIVKQGEGPNDGIVSVASATYGEQCDLWPGDHLSLVNWRNSRHLSGEVFHDRTADYANLLRRLADENF